MGMMLVTGLVERSYSLVLGRLFWAVNPIKKKIIKTECEVHKFINNQSVLILKSDGHGKAYNLMNAYLDDINEGAVWADQDFKSSNHFYSPSKNRGLFGRSNAQKEFMVYYNRALNYYSKKNYKRAMFYLGAACHLIQDVTVPQHANIKLMGSHRRYEQWIIKVYKKHDSFKAAKGGIYLGSAKDYIRYNGLESIKAYNKFSSESIREKRFYGITSIILVLAQKTTAGLMLNFYKDTARIRPKIKKRKGFFSILLKK
jgi:phospholipase C